MLDSRWPGLCSFCGRRQARGLQVVQSNGRRTLELIHANESVAGPVVAERDIVLTVRVRGDVVTFLYSLDEGKSFHQLGEQLPISFSWWKGSRPSIFAYSSEGADGAYVDIDWAHYTAR